MTTLFDVLKNTYLALGNLEITSATGGSTTTVVDTKMVDYGDDDLVNGTIFVIRDADGTGAAPQGEAQRISANSQSTQTITVDTAFSAAIATGDTIGIAKNVYPLHTLIELVNRALASLGTVQLVDTSLNTISGQVEYALPLALKYEIARVQISHYNYYGEIDNWGVIPAAAGTTGTLVLPNRQMAGRTLRLWYEAEHPPVALMSDVINETIHSEYITALTVEKALQWQNDRQSGQDAYMLQRLNNAKADADNARRQYAPTKFKKTKLLTANKWLPA